MNPFLEHLAARSLGAMPVLQPRRASRFEATNSSGTTELVTETEVSPTARHTDPPMPSQPMVEPASTSGLPEAAGPPPRRIAMLNLPSLPEPSPTREPFAAEEPVLREQAPLLNVSEPSVLLQTIRMLSPAAEPRPMEFQPGGQVQEVQPLLVEPSRPSVLQETIPLQKHDAWVPALVSPSAHREDIHISIGRIEIRALPAKAAQTSKRPQEHQPSTLDAYLRQRSSRRTS